ncbi:MAG: MotA/TolQ/ExbB proton channel family protein [Pararhodobacter sp.]
MILSADPFAGLLVFLARGGPALWAIAALSVLTLALILWKLAHLTRLGAWRSNRGTGHLAASLGDWAVGDSDSALARLEPPRGLRRQIARHAMLCRLNPALPDALAREEVLRVARAGLMESRRGVRALDLIATIAPLIGLLGTVLGMIEAFQALQEAGNRADPAALAGGIWQALLTTAAGMAVAIPAGVAVSWFDSIAEQVQADLEDLATRIFIAPLPGTATAAAPGTATATAPMPATGSGAP